MTPELAVQKAIRARLTSTTEIVALVPASSILDTNQRPAPDPAIIMGEGQTVTERMIREDNFRVYSTLHVWKKEPSLAGVKAIAGAMRSALSASKPDLEAGFHAIDCTVSDMRFMRDPDGETSHGVVTVETLVQEIA